MVYRFNGSKPAPGARIYASASEVVACFRDQEAILEKLALIITGDRTGAQQAVAQACELTLNENSPFNSWLIEWAKAATLSCAIALQRNAIRACEAIYKDRQCPHAAHSIELEDEQRTSSLALILQMNTEKIIAELDPLSRTVLVLRIAIRSSIQDCSLRLNVSRSAVVAANCLAMTWLDYCNIRPLDNGLRIGDLNDDRN